MPVRCVITDIQVTPGQKVKEGDVLATYRLLPDVIQQIRRRLEPPQIMDLQGRLADLDKGIASIDIKLKEARQLAREKMAPAQVVENLELERQLLAKQRAAAQERLQAERRIAKDDVALLKDQLGKSVKPDDIPAEASLLAPVSGHVMGINSDLREGAEIAQGTPAFVVGLLDPMVLKTQVHEIEASQIVSGDKAEVTLDSMPGRTFNAAVSRLSWSPSTPGVGEPSYYELELTVPNSDLSLREGFKGMARFPASGGQPR